MKLISEDGLYARNRHQQLYKLLAGSDALGYTRDYIRRFVNQSQQALKAYKPSPYKDALMGISEQIAATR
jgi:geranylgeranyl pyrophosphate synthase